MDTDYDIPEDITAEDDDYTFQSDPMQGERVDSPNSIDRIFDTESFLYSIKKTLLGWEYTEEEWKPPRGGTVPVATTETVNKIINSMRSFIHTSAMLAAKSDDEINYDMLELNKMVIFAIYDDPMVEEQDVEYIINLVDHSVGMFMSIIRGGEGSEAIRQIFSGQYYRLNAERQQNQPAFRFGTQNTDFFTLGGRRR